jgi:hypothetical protein
MSYPKERKESVLKKMLPPQNHSIPEVARAEGISEATLYSWRKAARAAGRFMPNDGHTPAGWTSVDKFAAVVETAALNELELAAYSRQRGLYPAQLQGWRQACEQANDWDRSQARRLQETRKADQHQIKQLARELRQKEKALAETAALLVLRKKAQAIWGEVEDV